MIILSRNKIVKILSLVLIDVFFMAFTYILSNKIFNANNLAIDPSFIKVIPLLILIKIGIYFIAGLYKEETRGMIFEISSVIFANAIIYVLLRFILKIGVSTYLQLIALTVDIIVESISRSFMLSSEEHEEEKSEPEVQTTLPQVFDDPIDYKEEIKLTRMKKELEKIKHQEEEKEEQARQALKRLEEKENRLKQKELELKNFEHTLSLKELNIQKELETLEKEKAEKLKLEAEIRKQEKLRIQRIKQEEILNGVLDNIKTIHTSLNERSKVVDMQEYNLMLKMYDLTKREIESKAEEEPRKIKHLSDVELLEETNKKIGQKRKRTNPYKKNKTTKETPPIKKQNSNKKLSEAIVSSPLLNESKEAVEQREKEEFMKILLKEKQENQQKETTKKEKPEITENLRDKKKNITTEQNKKKEKTKQTNAKNETKKEKQSPVDLMFSEDDFDKIAELIEKL